MRLRKAWNRFNRFQRTVIYGVVVSVFLIALFPKSLLSEKIVALGSGLSLICGMVWASTFWARVRIALDRLTFRYRVVRHNTAAIVLVGSLLLLSRATSIGLRNAARSNHSSVADSKSYTLSDPGALVTQCFCDELNARRKVDARQNYGVPRVVWPNYGDVIDCVQRVAKVDEQWANLALSKQRWEGDDGDGICRNVGLSMYDGDPPPASPKVMEAAHREICRFLAEAPGTNPYTQSDQPAPPEESQRTTTDSSPKQIALQSAAFASLSHISSEQAEEVLKRAYAEHSLANPIFLCPGEEPPPRDAGLKAPPTDDEIARARAAFCKAARNHPERLRGKEWKLFKAAERIYETSIRTTLERYRSPMVIDEVGDALLLGGWSPNSCS
jgi:hypothetical protein